MANRSYLYATDLIPMPNVKPADGRMIGISEWAYDVPIAYKLLLSGNPRLAISSIFQQPDPIAVVGDYDLGVARLLRELDKMTDPRIIPLRSEANTFLNDPANKRKFFVLECGEIFEMSSESLSPLAKELHDEISDLSSRDLETWLMARAPKPGLLARLFGRNKPTKNLQIPIDELGLGFWENVLYFDPTSTSPSWGGQESPKSSEGDD